MRAIKRSNDQDISVEASVISKKLKQQKKLETKETIVLQRLKETYAKQK
jgi:hypothetical protein